MEDAIDEYLGDENDYDNDVKSVGRYQAWQGTRDGGVGQNVQSGCYYQYLIRRK